MLKAKAKEIRVKTTETVAEAQTGHIGSALSIVEILVYLYYQKMDINLIANKDPNRDVFVLSKGHGCPSLYEVLKDVELEQSDAKLRELGRTP